MQPVTTLTKSAGKPHVDPREHASQKFISHFVPILSVRSDAWWLLFFTTPHLPLHCDPTCSRYLERSCCRCPYCMPIVSSFQASGLCLWFRLGHVRNVCSCLYPDVRLQKKQTMNMTTEIRHHQPFCCYTLEDGILSMYFILVYMGGRYIFSPLKIFCSSMSHQPTSLNRWIGRGLKLILSLINVYYNLKIRITSVFG